MTPWSMRYDFHYLKMVKIGTEIILQGNLTNSMSGSSAFLLLGKLSKSIVARQEDLRRRLPHKSMKAFFTDLFSATQNRKT